MKHSVTFQNAENHWDNALPLGNGVFGTMLYYEQETLYMPLNHYEVYYNINDSVLPSSKAEEDAAFCEKARQTLGTADFAYGKLHAERRRMADDNVADSEPFGEYRISRAQAKDEAQYSTASIEESYPTTGDLAFTFAPALSGGEHTLALSVEDASVTLSLTEGARSVEVRTSVLRQDAVLNEITASEAGLVDALTVSFAPCRAADAPTVSFEAIDGSTFVYTVRRTLPPSGKPFVFSGVIRLLGATAALSVDGDTATLRLLSSESSFAVLSGIFTEWQYENPRRAGLSEIEAWAGSLAALKAEHTAYWRAFFDRASISLPDKFLETVYYVNLYALDSCSGRDGVMKHHACGLNGLWAIKHPNLWGSMWYWDVNIQASFAGVFTGNRPELAKVFSDGLRSYIGRAERFALEHHGIDGISLDYPYPFYYSVWPWCAQYLWFHYEYTKDRDYLKNEAYPLFLRLCEFAVGLFAWDADAGYYRVYPDVSPEQGPLAHDTVATVSTVKYLLKFTLEAAKILGDTAPLLDRIRELYDHLPPYPIADKGLWGTPLKDSPDAPDNLWLRHPMVLMPIYPIGEFDLLSSDAESLRIASDTVDFTFDRSELGVFQGSWIAAACARIGRGNDAIRALYERGLDHMLRSNGLTAEATDRFMNYCLIGRQPLYYPCMMEFTGEMLAAVEEMLLASYNGVIRVFPAIPDGAPNYSNDYRYGYSIQEHRHRAADYPAWRDVRFDRLLAKGAFEISAALADGALAYIRIHSQHGGRITLTSPFLTGDYRVYHGGEEVAATYDGRLLSFDTSMGEEYLVALTPAVQAPLGEAAVTSPLTHRSAAKRHLFIGEDADTAYYRALDGATRAWYVGNLCHVNHTLYKLDMGATKKKEYWREFPAQAHCDAGRTMKCIPFLPIAGEAIAFTPKQGYGFANAEGITAVERSSPDLLRRDFLEGTAPAEFIIEAPRGQYELLVVSGDAEEDSCTLLQTEQGYTAGGDIVRAGRYQCELIPVMQKRDEPIRLRISTAEGKRWKLNLVILNVHKGY